MSVRNIQCQFNHFNVSELNFFAIFAYVVFMRENAVDFWQTNRFAKCTDRAILITNMYIYKLDAKKFTTMKQRTPVTEVCNIVLYNDTVTLCANLCWKKSWVFYISITVTHCQTMSANCVIVKLKFAVAIKWHISEWAHRLNRLQIN